MKLTGKCKEDFEKWFENQTFLDQEINDESGDNLSVLNMPAFYGLPRSMKWGVIQDFADSVDTCLETSKGVNTSLRYFWIDYISYGTYNTRQEARTAAVEKFNELYNDERNSR